jgi:hypothetical protein
MNEWVGKHAVGILKAIEAARRGEVVWYIAKSDDEATRARTAIENAGPLTGRVEVKLADRPARLAKLYARGDE